MTSAKTGENVDGVFTDIAKLVYKEMKNCQDKEVQE